MKQIDYKIYNKNHLTPSFNSDFKMGISTDDNEIKESQQRVLMQAKEAWETLENYRRRRTRCRNYTFGNQWSDAVALPDGRSMSEEMYLKEQGRVPLKNNLIRKLVKNVVGQFRSVQTQPVCVARDRKEQTLSELLSSVLQYVHQHNHLWEIDGRTLEEFLISGSCFHKIGYGYRRGKSDVWVDEVNPNRIFFNKMEDSRLWDCTLIGEIHDMSVADVLSHFAAGSRKRAVALRELYSSVSEEQLHARYDTLSSVPIESLDFFLPHDRTMCRVIEVWKYESRERVRCHDMLTGRCYTEELYHIEGIEAENRRRIDEAQLQGISPDDVPIITTEWCVERVWYYRFYTPYGHILAEGESPYWHGEHPYIFKLYPLIDGEIHSFVEDIIDQQRYINRLITLVDFIMSSSAKGVLLFPENQIPDGMTIEDIADEWTRYNGVIMFRPKPGEALPQQISVNATNVGAYELLKLQMQLLENISGVHGAMQGETPRGGTPAALYNQQRLNAEVNLIDLFESFKSFRECRDTKVLKVVQQFYEADRYAEMTGGKTFVGTTYSPDEVREAELDVAITESTSSPTFRSASNEFLLELFRMGQISLETLLEIGAFPFADRLLQSVERHKCQNSNLPIVEK